jgi:ATP-binding cassette subfamily C (CFTR/MRP) protein 1
MNFCCSRIYSV